MSELSESDLEQVSGGKVPAYGWAPYGYGGWVSRPTRQHPALIVPTR